MALALPVSMRAVSVVLGILAAGCLSDPSAERSAGAPIINGTPTSGDPAVGRVALGNDTCTGTLVAPNVVLTAKHCFARGTQPSQVSFRTGSFGDEPSCDAGCAAAGTCCDDCADDPASGDDPVVDEPAASDACDPDYCVADDGWCDEDLDCCDQDPDCEAAAEGDPAAPACLCDDACDDYGDCCADCTGAPDAAADDPQCYCDGACVEWQDCCDVC